jgi:hypothetical protein
MIQRAVLPANLMWGYNCEGTTVARGWAHIYFLYINMPPPRIANINTILSAGFGAQHYLPMLWIRIGFNADPDPAFISMRIRMRIRIQGAKPMRIQADPDLDQTSESQKADFLHEKYTFSTVCKRSKNIPTKVQKRFRKEEIQFCLYILANFHAPGTGSAFPVRIRIQDSKMNADPCGSGSTTLEGSLLQLSGVLAKDNLFPHSQLGYNIQNRVVAHLPMETGTINRIKDSQMNADPCETG